MRAALVLVVGLALTTLIGVAPAKRASGLYGTVTRGPTLPVCRVGDACGEPAARTVLVFLRSRRPVARVTTRADGTYRVPLDPGTYLVGAARRPVQPAKVRVRAGFRRIDFSIDTGILKPE